MGRAAYSRAGGGPFRRSAHFPAPRQKIAAMYSLFASIVRELAAANGASRRAKQSDAFADVAVVNQFGTRFRFRTDLVANRAVVINTMFTVCRGSCPGTSSTLQRLRVPLSRLFGKRVAVLSISIDPANDTP